VPTLSFKVYVTNSEKEEPIHSVALRCQIQIEAARRNYGPEEQERLRDLFGEPERWGQTLRPMLWTHASVIVPPFSGETVVDLTVACTFDFNVAATKYFAGLENGEVPLCLMFSGTIFYETEQGLLQVAQIPWDRDVTFRLPINVWRDMIDLYYPNTAWLCLRRDVFERLNQFKTGRGIPTWEQALEEILATVEEIQLEEKVH
jgi:hypothetical protein